MSGIPFTVRQLEYYFLSVCSIIKYTHILGTRKSMYVQIYYKGYCYTGYSGIINCSRICNSGALVQQEINWWVGGSIIYTYYNIMITTILNLLCCNSKCYRTRRIVRNEYSSIVYTGQGEGRIWTISHRGQSVRNMIDENHGCILWRYREVMAHRQNYIYDLKYIYRKIAIYFTRTCDGVVRW